MNALLNVYIWDPGRRVHVIFLLGGQKMVHTWHYSKFTEDTNWNKQKWCCCLNKNFSGTIDTIKHLKTFRIISNEFQFFLFILCWWYFSCLHMYLENFYKFYFHEQMFFKSLWQRETQVSFLGNNSLWTAQFLLTNLQVS